MLLECTKIMHNSKIIARVSADGFCEGNELSSLSRGSQEAEPSTKRIKSELGKEVSRRPGLFVHCSCSLAKQSCGLSSLDR